MFPGDSLLPERLARSLHALLCLAAAVPCTLSAQALAAHVDLQHNVLMPAAEGLVHSVFFRYTFDGPSFIRISGLGIVPPSGELSYLTRVPQIRFSGPDGRLLESINLKDATDLMGEASSSTPARSDFPATASGNRKPPSPCTP